MNTNKPRRREARGNLMRTLTCGLIVVALAAIAGCTTDATTSTKRDEIVLVTYESFALPEKAAAEFTRQTGTKIRVIKSGDAAEMLTKALLTSGSPEGDVIFGIDNTLATRAIDSDLLSPVDVSVGKEVDDRFGLGKDNKTLVPIDHGEVCLNYDAAWFTEHDLDAPKTLQDLTDERYKGLTVMPSPVTSSPGLAMLVGTVASFGDQGWVQYWERLKANDVLVRPSWSDAYYGDYTVSGGKRPIVVSYASSPPAEVVFSEGKRTEPVSEVATGTCVEQVEYAGVLKGTKNAQLAKRLLKFMVSSAWQQELPLTNFVYPVIDVDLPQEFQRWAPSIDDPLTLPADQINANREAWVERWREIME